MTRWLLGWDPTRLLYEDDDVVAVNKPWYAPTHAPDEGRTDDVHTRLGSFLSERDGAPAYLGIHQRLDKGTSGVLVFARRKSANPGLARAFEGRLAQKTYLAVVRALPPGFAERGELWHRLRREGAITLARPLSGAERQRLGREASGGAPLPPDVGSCAYRVLRRGPGACLLELTPGTGRTHQLRAQLAEALGPIVGDGAYGGEVTAHRPLLHAARLVLPHPGTGRMLVIEAPVPPVFEAALAGTLGSLPSERDALCGLLLDAVDRRHELARAGELTAYRLANGEGDGLPGVELDRYGDHLVLGLASDEALAREAELVAAVSALEARGVYVKRRPRQANTIAHAGERGLAPALPVCGEPATELAVREGPLTLQVQLGDGLSTGLFLDQRDNRAKVLAEARGKRFLNLFCYTGSFTVAAAAGGAASSVSVDASAAILARARHNLDAAGHPAERHLLVHADALAWLDVAAKRGDRFDLVVLDPPSYSTTKSSRFAADRDYGALVRRVVRVCAPGARLYCVTNHTGITRDRLRKLVREGARAEGVELARLTDGPEPADFPSCGERSGRAKSVIAELETGAGEVRYPHEWSHTGSPARSHHGSFVGSGMRRPRDPRRRGG